MDALFPPDRSLLYPQFETYRLQPLDPDEDIISFPLPGSGATQSRVGYNTHLLSFSEVQSRIEWNHLAIGPSGRGMYVDADWNVISFELDDGLRPIFSTLCTLPAPISKEKMQHQPEYPSCVEIQADQWAVADGAGTLYIVAMHGQGSGLSGEVVATHHPRPYQSAAVTNGESWSPKPTPFLIQGVPRHKNDKAARLMLSFAHPVEKGQKAPNSTMTTFELGSYAMDELSLAGSSEAGPSRSYFGSDLPVMVHSQSDSNEEDDWLVLCSKEYVIPDDWEATRNRDYERRERERLAEGSKAGLGATDASSAPSTQAGKASANASIEELEDSKDADQAPYSWTQTDESFSLRIPFRPSTPRDSLAVNLDQTYLDLSCSSTQTGNDPLPSFLERRKRKWWGDIDPTKSTFTYDPKTGVLDIEAVKKDTNVRWPSIFSPSEDDEDEDPFAEVPEKFDSATLAAVRESFDRIKRRESSEPEGNHPAIPALLREEMDYDLEDDEDYDDDRGMFGDTAAGHKVGREVQIGSLKAEQPPRWSKSTSTVLSLPLSGDLGDGMIVKSAVDGLLFRPPPSNPSSTAWRHVSTTPALSFVLSSKRDVRFVRHVTSSDKTRTTVLAFDSGAVPGSGNVYVYYPPTNKMTAKQGVVRISGGERGALLGVGELEVKDEKVVLALCEKELVVLSGVLRD